MIKAIWRPLCFLLVLICLIGNLCWKDYLGTKADSRFTTSMYRHIGETARELKAAGVDAEAVQTMRYAFEDVYRNVQRYVDDKSMAHDYPDFFLLMILVALFVGQLKPSISQKPRRSDQLAMMARAEAEAMEKKADSSD